MSSSYESVTLSDQFPAKSDCLALKYHFPSSVAICFRILSDGEFITSFGGSWEMSFVQIHENPRIPDESSVVVTLAVTSFDFWFCLKLTAEIFGFDTLLSVFRIASPVFFFDELNSSHTKDRSLPAFAISGSAMDEFLPEIIFESSHQAPFLVVR